MTTLSPQQHVRYLLRLADNGLVLSHRLSEWCGHGPVLEEDIALANVALDLLGQARLLYAHAGEIEGRHGAGFTLSDVPVDAFEDRYAYFRNAGEFGNLTMLELPNGGVASAGESDGDYAFAMVRNLLYSAFALAQWQYLTTSADTQLAAIAAKSVKETRYHLHHAGDWVVRLGDGTEESHRRAQHALDSLVPYSNEFFAPDALDQAAHSAGVGCDPSTLRGAWRQSLDPVIDEATLRWPADSRLRTTGKSGVHSEHLAHLLATMQSLAREHPGAVW